jgi:multiple sugar transport system permease protein
MKTTSTMALARPSRRDKVADLWALFVLLGPYVLLFSVFIALPVAIAIYLSLTSFNMVEAPDFIGMFNYIVMITQDDVFLRYILPNTLKFSIIVGPGGYIMAFLLAWMLAQIQPLPRTILSLAIYAPSMVGGVFLSVLWRTIFSGDESGFINAFLINNGWITTPIQFLQDPEFLFNIVIVVALWSSMGVGFLAMVAGILNGNDELYEAAYLDGVKNKLQEVIYVTIPMMRPQMLFGAVMSIVGTFTNGYIGVTLSGSNPTPQNAAQFIMNHIDDYGFQRYEMGYAAALSVVLLAVIWIFSKVAYRLFAERD